MLQHESQNGSTDMTVLSDDSSSSAQVVIRVHTSQEVETSNQLTDSHSHSSGATHLQTVRSDTLANSLSRDSSSSSSLSLTDASLFNSHRFSLTADALCALHGHLDKYEQLGGLFGIAQALDVNVHSGLHAHEIDAKSRSYEQRMHMYGLNVYPTPPQKSYFQFVRMHLNDTFLQILMGCGVFSLIAGIVAHPRSGFIEGIAICFAVAFPAFVSAAYEYRQQNEFLSFMRETNEREMVTVIRSGQPQQIEPDHIMVGDIVKLAAGRMIPADGILITQVPHPHTAAAAAATAASSATSIKVNESRMTGESVDVIKGSNDPFLSGGTELSEGRADMLVTAVGLRSAYGKILKSLVEENEPTPLQQKLTKAAKMMGMFGLCMAVGTFIALVSYWAKDIHQNGWGSTNTRLVEVLEFFIVCVALIVSAFPEGLPLSVTIALVFSMKRMMKDKIMVRRLAACETMGNVSTVCSDKTGTLTQNRMRVVRCTLGEMEYATIPTVNELTHNPCQLDLLTQAIVLSSQTWIDAKMMDATQEPEEWAWKDGNQTEIALMSFMSKYLQGNLLEARNTYQIIQTFPFDSTKKRSSVLIDWKNTAQLQQANMQATTHIKFTFVDDDEDESQCVIQETHLDGTTTTTHTTQAFEGPKSTESSITSAGNDSLFSFSPVKKKSVTKRSSNPLHVTSFAGSSGNPKGRFHYPFPKADQSQARYRQLYKGAAEAIVADCRFIVDRHGQVHPMSDKDRQEVLEAVEAYAKKGLRTLAFSYMDMDEVTYQKKQEYEQAAAKREARQQWLEQRRLKQKQRIKEKGRSATIIAQAAAAKLAGHSNTNTLVSHDGIQSEDHAANLQNIFDIDEKQEEMEDSITLAEDERIKMRKSSFQDPAQTRARQQHIHGHQQTVNHPETQNHPEEEDQEHHTLDDDDDDDDDQDEDEDELDPLLFANVLIGFVGIQDPLRPESYRAVRQCQRAGVIVRMVTGDHIETAKYISKECGIYTSSHHIAMTGPEFRQLMASGDTQKQEEVIPRLRVLARSSPQDKETLVRWLRQHNEIVGVTGDGTNDAPALSSANVGIAMFLAGTAVCKSAAKLWVLDDNFASIVRSIVWGRSIYDNIRKYLQCQFTVNLTAVIVSFLGACLGYAKPIPAVQLLWLNVIIDTLASVALASDRPVDTVLKRKPYKLKAKVVSHLMWRFMISSVIYQVTMCVMLMYVAPIIFPEVEAHSRLHYTLIFNTLTFMTIFNFIAARKVNEDINVFEGLASNPFFLPILFFCGFLQYINVEYLSILESVPLSAAMWGLCVGIGASVVPWSTLIRMSVKVNPSAGQLKVPPATFDGGHLNDPRYSLKRINSSRMVSKKSNNINKYNEQKDVDIELASL